MPFRFVGRSFMAFVLTPEPPLNHWLSMLDASIAEAPAFFAGRPVVLDLSRLDLAKPALAGLLAELQARAVRTIAVEGVDPDWLGPGLKPLAGGIRAGPVELPTAPEPPPKPAPQGLRAVAPAGLLLAEPIRSGATVCYPEGDVTVLGSVASGAEVIAGGSIHVYGTLRGRAIAGSEENPTARIFCRRFEPELLAINGLYRSADDFNPDLHGQPVQAWLDGSILELQILA